MQCVETLYSNPMFAGSMHHSPERLYADLKKESRILRGMHTGDWWWETQVRIAILVFALHPDIPSRQKSRWAAKFSP